ncbi:signal peptidase I [Candidatus Nesciobacter abundans]|uniref:signal peptidase I n=1 Tax=Candidatus Nesciobacter abundans TaxID=2601668 RepID=UPI001653986C|nr:signal peptidase I [Candidatus Nesciobacter abundans]
MTSNFSKTEFTRNNNKKKTSLSFYIISILIFLRVFVIEHYIVPSESMSRTMENGDIVLAKKYHGFSRMSIPFIGGMLPFLKNPIFAQEPKRGEVICFSLESEPQKLYTKRIIGVGGDLVQVKEGIIYINDTPLKMTQKGTYNLLHDNGTTTTMNVFEVEISENKKYEVLRKQELNDTDRASDNTPVFKVPKDHVFCIGDNMHYSHDFRFFTFTSFLHKNRIIAKPFIIIFGSKYRNNANVSWSQWIIRLPYSILMSIVNVRFNRVGKEI